jgi:hypothetical protein
LRLSKNVDNYEIEYHDSEDIFVRICFLSISDLDNDLHKVITSKVIGSSLWCGWPLGNVCVTNDHGYVPLVNISRSFPHLFYDHKWLITGFVTILTRRVSLVEQELFNLPEYLSSPPIFSGNRVTQSLVLCVCFADIWLSHWPLCCLFFVDLRILITLWYLQPLLIVMETLTHLTGMEMGQRVISSSKKFNLKPRIAFHKNN